MADSGFRVKHDSDGGSLQVRLLMDGKEVGSIIGNKGSIVKQMRADSGCRIFISDSSSPERIVTITGTTNAIYKAFQLITANVEEATERHAKESGGPGVPAKGLTMTLIVPASQCGSLIGKGGTKIKEMQEQSGATIQVATDMLPQCSERTVSVTGSNEAIAQCVYHIATVLHDCPPKTPVVPYQPSPRGGRGGDGPFGGGGGGNFGDRMRGRPEPFSQGFGGFQPKNQNPLASLLSAMQGGGAAAPAPPQNPLQAGTSAITALAALAGSQLRQPRTAASSANQQTHEITVPNELIGCILGRRGSKIAEIRQMTGAMITITKFDSESEEATSQERIIRIKGTSDQVALAQYLINTSVEMHKANLEGNQDDAEEASGGLNPNAIPLANLLKNPAALNALSSITNINLNSLGGLQELLAGDGSASMSGGGGGGGRQSFQPRMRAPPGGSSPPREQRRDRFQPY